MKYEAYFRGRGELTVGVCVFLSPYIWFRLSPEFGPYRVCIDDGAMIARLRENDYFNDVVVPVSETLLIHEIKKLINGPSATTAEFAPESEERFFLNYTVYPRVF